MTRDEIRAYCRKRKWNTAYADYWYEHQVCEACRAVPSAAPHHIRSRGAHGAIDWPWNLLALCHGCHISYHAMGYIGFAEWNPRLADKIAAAIDKAIP